MSDPTPAQLRDAAVTAHRAGRYDEALKAYVSYLRAAPNDAGIWSNLGALFRSRSQHQQARRAQAHAYALAPDAPGVRNNYANVLSDIGEYEHSIELRRELLRQTPQDAMQEAMIGRCLRGMGRYEDAIAHLQAAQQKHPDDSEIPLQLAFAQLGAGQYGRAFRSYGARWESNELKAKDLPFPKWEEGMDLDGKTVLVVPEQGFGDAVLFTRFLPELKRRGAKVYYLAEKPLARLFRDLPGTDWVGTELANDAPVDLWMNLMDMPLVVYGSDEEGVPPDPTVLTIPEDSLQRAQQMTKPWGEAFKVGVVWSGSATYKGNAFRSFSHTDFLPMTDIPGVQLFSLYKGPYLEAYKQDGSSAFIIDTASTDRDFADCAATMKEMDLIITSDTVSAHLAGTLGVPVWTVLHWDAFWVWRHAGDTTEWYPGMRLFRQHRPLDWTGVMEDVKATLVEHVKDAK